MHSTLFWVRERVAAPCLGSENMRCTLFWVRIHAQFGGVIHVQHPTLAEAGKPCATTFLGMETMCNGLFGGVNHVQVPVWGWKPCAVLVALLR